jgi:GPH family glycoside/pentoside/hexuronide:cation symporter
MRRAGRDAGDLSLAGVLAFSTVSIPIAALHVALTVHLPRYFATNLGLELAVVGAAFGLVRLIDIPIDAAIGVGMDRTRSRLGRYRLWMLLGAPLLMLGLARLATASAGIGQAGLIGWLLVMYLGYSAVYLSHLAWAATLSPTYRQRSRLFGAVTGTGFVGAIAVVVVPVLMSRAGTSDAGGVRAMIWFIVAAVPVTVLLAALSTREQISRDHRHGFRLADYLAVARRLNVLRVLGADLFINLGPGWMAAMYLFYFRDSRGFGLAEANLLLLGYIAAGLLGAPLTAWLANRIGKHRALMVNTTVYSAGLVSAPFLPPGAFAVFLPMMCLIGAMQAGFTVMIRALAGDVADELRLETGREWTGLIYALINATSKLAQAAAILLTFNVALAAAGYDAREGAVNTPEAIRGLELAFIVGPVGFVLLAGACFLGYPLGPARHAEIRRKLEALDAQTTP